MKTQNTDWSYLFKHWIFTLLLGPVISQIIAFIPIFYPSQAVGLLAMFPILLSLVLSFQYQHILYMLLFITISLIKIYPF